MQSCGGEKTGMLFFSLFSSGAFSCNYVVKKTGVLICLNSCGTLTNTQK